MDSSMHRIELVETVAVGACLTAARTRTARAWPEGIAPATHAPARATAQPCGGWRFCAASNAAICSGVASRWCLAFQSANGSP